MRFAALTVFLWLFALESAHPQPSAPVIIPGTEVWDHVLQPQHTWVHFPTGGRWMPIPIRLTLTVSPQGDVIDVEPHGNPGQMQAWPIAETIVYGWKYRPFLRGGQAVTARVQGSISIVPPEVPPKPVPEPELKPDSQITLSLQRTVCYGSCPEYTVTLSNAGVVFEGGRWSAVDGLHHATLERDALRTVAKRMLDAGWFGLEDNYHGNWTDNPTQTITLSIDGRTKKVVDYVGTAAGMPDFVRDAEYEVDQLAGADRWVKASSGLTRLLRAEGFDFKTYAAPSLLRTAAANGDVSSVRELLAAGVARETLSKPQQIQSWGEGWSGYDGLLTTAVHHPDIMELMIDFGVSSENALEKTLALIASVRAGQAESARLLLAYGRILRGVSQT